MAAKPAPRPPTGQAGGVIGPSDTGVGLHWATQLYTAVQFLKRHGNPIRLEDLALMSGVEALLSNSDLLESLSKHDRVEVDPKLGLYSYRPDLMLKSKADLLTLLRLYATRGGLTVKALRESWPQVTTAIEELEREGRVFVTRTGGNTAQNMVGIPNSSSAPSGNMKAVFLDEIGPQEKIDEEFRQLWHKLSTPIGDELANELREAGLNAASSTAAPTALASQKKKGRKGPGSSNRRLKITNTHLKEVDLSKDYTKS